MKIFNRGTDPKAATTAVASTAPAPAAAPAPTAPMAPAPTYAPAPAAPAAAPDLSVILDANVKEMSEKIARLASTLENAQQERSGFEAKIEQMEDRMRKLSSLTEMISAQYNPFVGDAPTERNELPRPEVGLAPPPVAAPLPPPPSMPLPPPPPPPFETAPTLSAMIEPPAPDFATLPPLAALHAPAVEQEPLAPMPLLAPIEPAPRFAPALPAAAPEFPADGPGVYLWSVNPGFESSMLLLGWADMLLKSAGGRDALVDLVNYYHNVGWIGDPARDQLLAYADGLVAPENATHDWRADVEVHEKSLLFVEKLRAVSMRRHG